jgi:hypothetical protein
MDAWLRLTASADALLKSAANEDFDRASTTIGHLNGTKRMTHR